VLTDNGGEFRSSDFRDTLDRLAVRHTLIRAGRPQTNGAVEALHRLILEECWRPAFARYLHVGFTGLKRDLDTYVED
jgi:transposase InsO family protein